MTAEAAPAYTLMHGAHNTFAILDERNSHSAQSGYSGLAQSVCAEFDTDGLLVVRAVPGYDAEMRIFNRDGSESEMCGNGLRCVVRYLAERSGIAATVILTESGPVPVAIVSRDPFIVRTEIGRVTFPLRLEPQGLARTDRRLTFYAVSVGNPHAVLFLPEIDALDMEELAESFRDDPRFPSGVNVHAVARLDERTLRVRHFERGAGETQACGSGAVACAAAAIALETAISPVTVLTPGGALVVDWRSGGPASLDGPAEFIP